MDYIPPLQLGRSKLVEQRRAASTEGNYDEVVAVQLKIEAFDRAIADEKMLGTRKPLYTPETLV